jgi:hypothetical protein
MAANSTGGFLTTRPPQVRPLTDSAKIQPILTTGDTLPNGYTMAAIPDGLGAMDNGDGTFTLMMNHELTPPENLTSARVSKLVIDKKTLRVLSGSYPINGTEGYHRFCSALFSKLSLHFGIMLRKVHEGYSIKISFSILLQF